MESLVEYLIPYKGLSIGKHDYQFHVQNSFFVAIESDGIKSGDLNVTLSLDKQSRLITANLNIEGTVKLVCDRCLDTFDFPIKVEYEQLFKFGNKPEMQEDEIIYLQNSEYRIDISHLILENILLEIPIKRVHEDDKDGDPTCDSSLMEMIQNYGKKKEIDPRWDALKNLNFDD